MQFPLAAATPDLLSDVMIAGLAFILWQTAMLVRARRAVRAFRWALIIMGPVFVLDAVWRLPRTMGHRTLGTVLDVIDIVASIVVGALLMIGLVLAVIDLRPRGPRRRRRRIVLRPIRSA